MAEFYEALASLDPNARNVVMTVVEGPHFGDKCLLSGGNAAASCGEFFPAHLEEARAVTKSGSVLIIGEKVFCEVLGHEKKFVICGGGHISMPLIQMCRMLGCPVTVLEDRPTFADNARAAGATQVICDSFEQGLARVEGDEDTFFIIVTRGHRHDKVCLNAISRKRHAYIGMIGSRRRVTLVKQNLVEEEGCDPEVIAAVHTPIGLKIGAETPEEIAIAIMAEIIQVKSESGRNSTWPREIIRTICSENAAEGPKALATIIARKGSAPRDVGTKMLILQDGRCVGTIGGGCVEADVTRSARMMLDDPAARAQVFHVDMTGDAAEDEGMVCGGVIDVLVEIIR